MIIIDSRAINESAILSISETKTGWTIEFTDDRPNRNVYNEPCRSSVIQAPAGTQLWALESDDEFSRHSIIGWTILTSVITGKVVDRNPILSTGHMDEFTRSDCLVVDTVVGMACSLGIDYGPSSDIEGWMRSIRDEAQDRRNKIRSSIGKKAAA